MSTSEFHKAKTIAEAVEEGSLIDVSDVARKFRCRHRTFITPVLFEQFKAFDAGQDDGLEVHIGFAVFFMLNDVYGPKDNGKYECILEPHEEFGHVVLVAEHGRLEEIGLKRTTGDRIEYAM